MSAKGAREGIVRKLLEGESADETVSAVIDTRFADRAVLVVETGAGVSGGVVRLEGSPDGASGTWVQLATITTNAANTVFAQMAVLNSIQAIMPYMRARIETIISGGTIDAYLHTLE